MVMELRKTIKKTMTTGIAQKSCIALFQLCSLRKNDIWKSKKKNTKRKGRKHSKELQYLNREKIKTKNILILIML